MARVVPVCDTDIGPIQYTTNGQFRCNGPGATVAWIEVEEEDLNVQTLADLSLEDGGLIAGAVVGVWTIGYVCRLVIITIFRTRFG